MKKSRWHKHTRVIKVLKRLYELMTGENSYPAREGRVFICIIELKS